MSTKKFRSGSSWLAWVVLGLILALVLGACGDTDQNSTQVSAPIRPSPTATATAAAPTTPAPAASGTTAAAGGTTAASGGSTSGDAAAGQALFTSAKPIACAQCHANGGRAAGVGPVLAGTQRDDAYIRNQLKNGKGAMPAYPNLTEAQQNDLIAYIRSLK